MNLPKAKELLQLDLDDPGSIDILELNEAQQLGVEAIDRLQDLRANPRLYPIEPLPSETE